MRIQFKERFTSKESIMGQKDITAGRIKQIKGRANKISVAVTGNAGRQARGKIQQAVGKAQIAMGELT
jgi:uncharacterized protein YjbJ (UPF0337 family)